MKNKILITIILIIHFIPAINHISKCQNKEYNSVVFGKAISSEKIEYDTYHNIVIKGNSTGLIDNFNRITSCYLISNVYSNVVKNGITLTSKNFLFF